MSIASELLALKGKDGMVHAPAAVDWAKEHPESSLYAALEWDDPTAAKAYRIEQVRQLIRIFVVDVKGDRQLISLSVDRAVGGYRSLDDVLARPDLREVMLNDALAELERLEIKYEHLKELAEVWAAKSRVASRTRKRGSPPRRPPEGPRPRA